MPPLYNDIDTQTQNHQYIDFIPVPHSQSSNQYGVEYNQLLVKENKVLDVVYIHFSYIAAYIYCIQCCGQYVLCLSDMCGMRRASINIIYFLGSHTIKLINESFGKYLH